MNDDDLYMYSTFEILIRFLDSALMNVQDSLSDNLAPPPQCIPHSEYRFMRYSYLLGAVVGGIVWSCGKTTTDHTTG